MLTAFGLVAAALIGVSLGMMGAGGSILTVPVFIYLLGFGAKEAIASALVVVGVTSLIGAVVHWRGGRMKARVAAVFGVFTMIGAYAGARLAFFMSGGVQMLLFAAVMLATAFFMLRGGKPGGPERFPSSGAFSKKVLALSLPGLAVGGLTGIVGVGGGFLIVPALVLLTGMAMKEAVGTSLLVIAMNSASAFAGYLNQVELNWLLVGGFIALAIAGSFAGTRLASTFSDRILQRVLAVFLIVLSFVILYGNHEVLLRLISKW